MNVYIKGLNVCPLRRQNLSHYRSFLERNGHHIVPEPSDGHVILVWTCGFRKDVIENSITQLERYAKSYSGEVIALGCLPDIDRKALESKFDGLIVPWKKQGEFLERYFGAETGSFPACSPVFHQNALCHDAAEYRRLHADADVTFADQFLKLLISQGCPYQCTYCTEKLAFPPYQSVSEHDLVEACRVPVMREGQHRIILMADCLGKYGTDTGSSLPELIRRLHAEYPQTVYALQNLHPRDFLDWCGDIKQFINDGWIAHLNLPIQSASSRVLAAMNRPYAKDDLDKVFGLLTSISFRNFDTHIIVGFPGETEDDFMETVGFLRKYKPTYALVSKYYDAPGASSSKIANKVDERTIGQRMEFIEHAMREIGMVYNIDGSDFNMDRLSRINRKVTSI